MTTTFAKILVDTNDADYVTSFFEVTVEEIALIRKVANALLKNTGHNWPYIDYDIDAVKRLYDGLLTESEIKDFNDLIIVGDYGCHTIDSIKFLKVESEEKVI